MFLHTPHCLWPSRVLEFHEIKGRGAVMLVIENESELQEFEQRNGLVALYVDNGYNPKFHHLVGEMQRAFDENVGPAWHLLIPIKPSNIAPRGGYAPDAAIDTDSYNIAFARMIAEQRGIAQASLPAIVFEFVPKKEYYSISLSGMEVERVRKIVAAIGEIAREEFGDGGRELTEFRAAAHARIVRYLREEKAIHFVKQASPTLAAMIATLAGVKAITG